MRRRSSLCRMWLSCFGPEPAGGSWSWWELASAHRVASQTSGKARFSLMSFLTLFCRAQPSPSVSTDPQGVACTTTCSSITSHTQRPFLNLTISFTIPSRFSHWPRSYTLGSISLMSLTTSFDCFTTRSCFCGSTHRTSMGLREVSRLLLACLCLLLRRTVYASVCMSSLGRYQAAAMPVPLLCLRPQLNPLCRPVSHTPSGV